MLIPPDLNTGVCHTKTQPVEAQLAVLLPPYIWPKYTKKQNKNKKGGGGGDGRNRGKKEEKGAASDTEIKMHP